MKNSSEGSRFYKMKICLVFSLLTTFIMNSQDFSDLYEKLNPSVVTILTTETVFSNGGISQGSGLGSGVIIDKKGFVMTAAHVVGSAETINPSRRPTSIQFLIRRAIP